MNFGPILPEIVLLVGTCGLMLADLYVKDERRALTFWLAHKPPIEGLDPSVVISSHPLSLACLLPVSRLVAPVVGC